MKSPWRALFGVAVWLPAVGVLALTAWAMCNQELQTIAMRLDLDALRHFSRATLVEGGVLLGATVIAQFAIAAVAAVHMEKRTDVSGTEKIMWPVACLFVGSIAGPIFFFKKIRA